MRALGAEAVATDLLRVIWPQPPVSVAVNFNHKGSLMPETRCGYALAVRWCKPDGCDTCAGGVRNDVSKSGGAGGVRGGELTATLTSAAASAILLPSADAGCISMLQVSIITSLSTSSAAKISG